jgi:Helix-turn-helix domain
MAAVQADLEPLLTTSQVAHILGTHPSACVRWIQKGTLLSSGARMRLEAVATPGGWRIRRSSLDAFLSALTDDRTDRPTAAATVPARSARHARMHSRLAAKGLIPKARKKPGAPPDQGVTDETYADDQRLELV